MTITKIKEITDFYGCQKCGVCCKTFNVHVQNKELQQLIALAEEKGMKLETIGKELILAPSDVKSLGNYMFKFPCVFLENNKCSIYNSRPLICKTFPFRFIFGSDFLDLAGYHICPMATQILDEFADSDTELGTELYRLLKDSKTEEVYCSIHINDFMTFFEKRKGDVKRQ